MKRRLPITLTPKKDRHIFEKCTDLLTATNQHQALAQKSCIQNFTVALRDIKNKPVSSAGQQLDPCHPEAHNDSRDVFNQPRKKKEALVELYPIDQKHGNDYRHQSGYNPCNNGNIS